MKGLSYLEVFLLEQEKQNKKEKSWMLLLRCCSATLLHLVSSRRYQHQASAISALQHPVCPPRSSFTLTNNYK